MDIILSNSSDKPIYEQIASQIRAHILAGTLVSGEKLPSIRALANGLGVSVITTKRAYSDLEEAGFIETVQGKGCFVAAGNQGLLREEELRAWKRCSHKRRRSPKRSALPAPICIRRLTS